MTEITNYFYASIPLLIFCVGLYLKLKNVSSEKKISIILESLPDAKDKIDNLLNPKGRKNAKKPNN